MLALIIRGDGGNELVEENRGKKDINSPLPTKHFPLDHTDPSFFVTIDDENNAPATLPAQLDLSIPM